jgi:hypothetical protein
MDEILIRKSEKEEEKKSADGTCSNLSSGAAKAHVICFKAWDWAYRG